MKIHVSTVKQANRVDYVLRYWDGKRHLNIPRASYKRFESREEAEKYAKSKNAIETLLPHSRALKNLEWKSEFHDFNELIESFTHSYLKTKCKNSWKESLTYLNNYVLPYFLGQKKENNLNLWYQSFFSFKYWLEKDARTTRGNRPLSPSTINHCIRTLNSFIKHSSMVGKVDLSKASIKCAGIEQDRIDACARKYEDVIKASEFQSIYEKLSVSKEIFLCLLNTGMRFNEIYSLPLNALYKGDEKLSPVIKDAFYKMGKKIYGYIYLESQIKHKHRTRNDDHSIDRKPLKSKRAISPKYARLIPIVDELTWTVLSKRRNESLREFKAKKFNSSDPNDYFLFGEFNLNKVRKEFHILTNYEFHACRHSFVTFLLKNLLDHDVAGAETIVREITGHKSKAFERYSHILEDMNRSATDEENLKDEF